jgi:hypothetical protein
MGLNKRYAKDIDRQEALHNRRSDHIRRYWKYLNYQTPSRIATKPITITNKRLRRALQPTPYTLAEPWPYDPNSYSADRARNMIGSMRGFCSYSVGRCGGWKTVS